MRRNFSFIFTLILISCNSYRIEKSVFNDFINQKITSKQNTANIYLVEESESKLKALDFYEKAFMDRNKSDYFKRKIVANVVDFNVWPIDSLEICYLKKNLSTPENNASGKWKSSDFNEIKIAIKKNNSIKEDISRGNSSLNVEAFSISKPLLSRNKQSALVFYSSFGYFNGGQTKDKVALLQIVNRKWTVITYFYDPKIME